MGSAIVNELLLDENAGIVSEVRVLDIQMPITGSTKKIIFFQGDIRHKDIVNKACQGVDIVIHAAAIVDWGTRTANEVLDINTGGTKHVIQSCLDHHVRYLIYTSSLDAIFSGQPMVNVDESIPFPVKPVNAYCESKQRAEVIVQRANGQQLKTCILRPADIYGEGDPYHIGSLINMAKKGFYVRLGNGRSKCQHVYVRNIAHAHV